ncbi:MAG TPA: colicin V synthesis protein, partial [Lactobacillus sp.]|nr:colicin V synthesis protein [Lactobacillus sp.]
ISLWFHDLTYKAMGHRKSAVIGGIANLVIGYIFLFLILALLALIPIAGIQQGLDHSIVAKVMIKYSPGLTQFVNALWL